MLTWGPFLQQESLAEEPQIDLIVLVPDVDWEQTVRTLLTDRVPALGIRKIEFDVIRHPNHDPGVRTGARALLQTYVGNARYAMACADHEGSGHHGPADALAADIESSLRGDWGNRCAAVVVEPELERWVWSPSPNVAEALGWGTNDELRRYLEDHGMVTPGETKPSRPKEAMLAAMREKGKRRSPAVFVDLARTVSLATCSDPTFEGFRNRLRLWFPPIGSS